MLNWVNTKYVPITTISITGIIAKTTNAPFTIQAMVYPIINKDIPRMDFFSLKTLVIPLESYYF